MKRNTRVLSL